MCSNLYYRSAQPMNADQQRVPLLVEDLHSRSARTARMLARFLGESVMAGFCEEDVTEVYSNPHDGAIWFDTRAHGKIRLEASLAPNRIEQFLNAVADLHGLTIGAERPALQAELPLELFRGARLQGFCAPMAAGPCFVVRKPPTTIFPLDHYVDQGMLMPTGRAVLRQAVLERWNVLVAGGVGSGKTTFVNALLQEVAQVCPDDRVVILEDTAELQCRAADHLALRTPIGGTLAELVRHTLRAYPRRIVVGEVRGAEALDLLDAWSTGHPGGLGTFHAQDASAALLRLDRLCQRANVPSQTELIADAVDLIVIMEGGHRARRVRDLVRVHGLRSGGTFHLESLADGGAAGPSP